MASVPPQQLSARKSPRQARATATLEAIFEATIQVLLADGPTWLTTTRVSERAGVSVGTMYQYYPHKQALLYAVTERYLNVVAETVERTCLENHGAPLAQMCEALVKAYWDAKTMRRNATRALYLVTLEVNTSALSEACTQRIETASAAMINSASDAKFTDLALVNLTLLTTLFGTVRGLFTREMSLESERQVGDQLTIMCLAYLETSKKSS